MKLSVHSLLSAVGLGHCRSSTGLIPGPRNKNKARMIRESDHSVFIIDLQVHSHIVLYTAVWNVYVVCTTDDVQ